MKCIKMKENIVVVFYLFLFYSAAFINYVCMMYKQKNNIENIVAVFYLYLFCCFFYLCIYDVRTKKDIMYKKNTMYKKQYFYLTHKK